MNSALGLVIKAGFTEEVILDMGFEGWLGVHPATSRVRTKGIHVNNLV